MNLLPVYGHGTVSYIYMISVLTISPLNGFPENPKAYLVSWRRETPPEFMAGGVSKTIKLYSEQTARKELNTL